MKQLTVELDERSYPIFIAQDMLSHVGTNLKERQIANRYAIIADSNVARLYGQQLTASLNKAGIEHALFTFPPGEESKTLQTFATLASAMAQHGFNRHDGIISFGGGVSGDLAGYLAASYMRGIPFVQIPTTLLGQVDSAVGGKTGVDIAEGKNLIGAFYQPQAVYTDISLLATLPKEELLGGLAEVIKYGVIKDAPFFHFLAEEKDDIVRLSPEKTEKIITTCCTIKANVVAEDEKEGGVRRILNFGHTIGHAVEAASHFQRIHGFAVAIGMAAAAKLALLCGYLSQERCDTIIAVIQNYGLPVDIPAELSKDEIKRFLLTDKKNISGKVVYILPTDIGETIITADIAPELVDQVLQV